MEDVSMGLTTSWMTSAQQIDRTKIGRVGCGNQEPRGLRASSDRKGTCSSEIAKIYEDCSIVCLTLKRGMGCKVRPGPGSGFWWWIWASKHDTRQTRSRASRRRMSGGVSNRILGTRPVLSYIRSLLFFHRYSRPSFTVIRAPRAVVYS